MQERLRFSIEIAAPVEAVWETMLGYETYRQWKSEFSTGSHYVGDWSAGSKMQFLAPDEHGTLCGMVSLVKENRPYERIEVERLGIVADEVERTSGEDVEAWVGTIESYMLKKTSRGTQLVVEVDIDNDFKEMFETTWPRALKMLKKLAEDTERRWSRPEQRQ